MLEGKIGYVRLFNFHTGSANALQTAVDGLMEQGAKKLIFDVRQNGGGYVKELTQMLDYLLPEGVVFQQSTDWGWSHRKESDAACIDLPMTVLMDGGSYSCAELFAAQLKESAGARLAGEHTVGKGYFQYYFPILNGGRLGLSIGRYTTGAGVWLAKTGLEPDIEISLSQEELTYFNARWLAVEEDPQLQAAILGEE
jgi:carboxyl-terminal processing protease